MTESSDPGGLRSRVVNHETTDTKQLGRALCTASVITPNSYLPSLDITSIPSHFFENEDQDGVLDELSLRPSATSVNLPSGLSKLIALLLILGENSIDIGSAETVRAAAIDFRAGRRFEESNLPQIVGTVDEHPWTLAQAATAVEFAEYCAFAEVAIVEQSPAKRASPAAIQASQLLSRLMTFGGGGTLSGAGATLVLHPDHGPMIVIVGAATTLVIGAAGSGLTLMTHWIGKKLEI